MLRVLLASSGGRLSRDREREYLARLPAAMRASIGRYRRWEDRQAGLFGKLLLQRALGCRPPAGEPSSLERLEYTPAGKPYLRGGPCFNISHSGGVVVLALADSGEVGIDVERIRPTEIEDFAAHLPELRELYALDAPQRLESFFACWTRKEAVLKAEGSGLLVPLEQVRLRDDTAYLNGRPWHLRKIDCGAAYCCHVATSEPHAVCGIEIVEL